MDINLPGISGLQALNILRKMRNKTYSRPCTECQCDATRHRKGLKQASSLPHKPLKIGEFMEALDKGLNSPKPVPRGVKGQSACSPRCMHSVIFQ